MKTLTFLCKNKYLAALSRIYRNYKNWISVK